jgi:tetratricopeptide (TPR) repeat protein
MVHSLLFVLVLSGQHLAASPTPETVDDELRRAVNEYHYGNYAKAIEQLQGLLSPMRLNTDEQFLEAQKFLAFSYYLSGSLDLVDDEFAKLLYLSPDYELDPFAVPPPIIERFENVRRTLKKQLNVVRERKRKQDLKQKSTGLTIRTVEHTVVEQSSALTLLPFGAGQFQNGEYGAGAAFLLTELAFLTINVGAYLYSLTLDHYAPSQRRLVEGVTLAQYGGLALFGITWTVGVFQARFHFVPEYTSPPRISEQSIEKTSLGGTFQFQFDF